MSQPGPDVSRLMPADAVAALRSFPRRFGAVLTVDDDDNPERLEPARAEAEAAAGALESYGAAVARALVDSSAAVVVAQRDQNRSEPSEPHRQSIAAVLDRITLEAGALADRVERVPAGDWAAGGALDLVREAVRTVAARLGEAERRRTDAGLGRPRSG